MLVSFRAKYKAPSSVKAEPVEEESCLFGSARCRHSNGPSQGECIVRVFEACLLLHYWTPAPLGTIMVWLVVVAAAGGGGREGRFFMVDDGVGCFEFLRRV